MSTSPAVQPEHPAKLEISEVSCERGYRKLIENLSFSIEPGELIQLEGANGSGKTTLLRTLCGLSLAAAGKIRWRGENIEHSREDYFAELLYLGHKAAIKDDFTALENLRFNISMHQSVPATAKLLEALDMIGLKGFETIPARHLSAGQRRRVALARLLISEQALWVLDEPFTAIDKHGSALLCDLIGQHCRNGGMVILTSHTPVEIEGVTLRRIKLG